MIKNGKKQRILITGSTGFLGQAVMNLISHDENYQVIGTNSKIHDLTDLNVCKEITKNVDIIVNLAGLIPSRTEQQKRPAEVFFINTIINLNIAEAARQNKVSRIIFISSVTAYPENIPAPFIEDDLWSGPVSSGNYSYGTAKRITETIAHAYHDQYGIKAVTLFLPNLYGPNDKFFNTPPPLVPNIINQIQRAITENSSIFLGGNNGDVELDLLYVTDAANAILQTIYNENIPTMLNISSKSTISIKKIYALVADKLHYHGTITWEPGEAPPPRVMDSTNAQGQIGWQSRVSFVEGISNTIDDYLINVDIQTNLATK